jgi:cytoskeletal protein RodZ
LERTDIGKILKKEREKQNLTIDDIAKKTLIRQYYIEQIENNEFEQYDGFINAYIRKYAEALGIDSKHLVNAYKSLFSVEKDDNKAKEIKTRKKWVYITSIIAIAISIFVVVFLNIHARKPLPNNSGSQEINLPSNNEVQKPPEKTTPSNSVNQESKNPQTPVEKKAEGVSVTISADELCWVGVTIDDKYTQLFIHKGEKKTFKGKKYVKVKFGNAIHAYVNFNGKDLGVVSKDKRVVEKVYKAE